MLLGFAGWTLLILLVGVGARRVLLIFQGKAALTSFPGDMAHGSAAYRRAVRAHANCVENLPVFGAIILTAAAAGLSTPSIDRLATISLTARVLQTLIHLCLPETNATIAARFAFFLPQILAMIAMGIQIGLNLTVR